MKPNEIKTFFDYNFWAFERVWGCIMQLNDNQFAQPIDYSTGSIREHVVHMASAIYRRIQQLQGKDIPSHLTPEDFPTRETVKARWDKVKNETYAYLSTLTESDLDGKVQGKSHDTGAIIENTPWEILLHMVNHATDHRSQILAMLHHHFEVETLGQDMMACLVEQNQ